MELLAKISFLVLPVDKKSIASVVYQSVGKNARAFWHFYVRLYGKT
jgi:hypothetical protein